MATHSSVLAWRIPGTGEPDGLLSMGSHRVGHDWSDLAAAVKYSKQNPQRGTSLVIQGLGLSAFTAMAEFNPWLGNDYPTSCVAWPKKGYEKIFKRILLPHKVRTAVYKNPSERKESTWKCSYLLKLWKHKCSQKATRKRTWQRIQNCLSK